MTTMRWFQSGATPRGTPSTRRGRSRPPVVLAVLAVLALGQTGCQSGLCGPCGSVRTGFRNLSERAFRPFRSLGSAGPCCGSSLGGEAAPIPYGSAPTVVSPAPIGSPASSSVAPSDSLTPSLEPIPSATPGPPPASSGAETTPSQGNRSSAGKANYEAFKPKPGGQASGPDASSRSLTLGPEPTTRSAQGSGRFAESDANPLDNLPPIDIPKDITTPGSPSSGAKPALPAPAPAPGDDVFNDNTPAPPAAPASSSVAPGIRRFAGVGPKLAGGSLPTLEGLDWLAETGYRTILDLRENVALDSKFLGEVDRRGLRYVALPITLKTVDSNHVTRFRSELALADARPLYFCDTDGTRAGSMWYIHRLTVDKVDEQVARRDAEELGLTDAAFLDAARAFVAALKRAAGGATPAAAPAPAPAPASAPGPGPGDPKPAAVPPPSTPPQAALVVPSRALDRKRGSTAQGPKPSLASWNLASGALVPSDPTAWRPFAALVVTSLGIPLAYFTRSAVPDAFRSLARASLPAPSRSQRSLPGGSGV